MRLWRLSWLFLPSVLVTEPMLAATLSHKQLAGYEQVGRRFGLTPQQVSEVYGFIDRNNAQIKAAAALQRVNQTAFKAIAREFGLRNYGADPKALVEAIRAQAVDAARFEKNNTELRKQIAALENAAIRAPAEAILARADAAYAAGNLDRAQSALEELIAFRTSELTAAYEAWEAAHLAAVNLALTRGDLDRVGRLNDEAEESRKLRAEQQREADRYAAWSGRITEAKAWFYQGRRFGKVSDYDKATSLYFDLALPLVPKEKYATDWAETQNLLGIAFAARGAIDFRHGSTLLFANAVAAYEAALTVHTKADWPAKWALIQNNLGAVLLDQGERSSGEERSALLARAEIAFENTLTISTKVDAPSEWAATQINLGKAFFYQGEGSGGEVKRAMAVTALEDALTIFTRADNPTIWATAQTILGTILATQGQRATGKMADSVLAKAVASFEAALTVHTKVAWPSAWANIQNSLGIALQSEGERTIGGAGTTLLARAVTAFENALTIRTQSDVPAGWATTQHNLGLALFRQSQRSSGDSRVALLTKAVAAFEAALTKQIKDDAPAKWALFQSGLGLALADQGELTEGDAGMVLLTRAVAADEAALTVFDEKNFSDLHQRVTRNIQGVLTLIAERQGQPK
jgi:tetratricopeptide (TPR) repeat protein